MSACEKMHQRTCILPIFDRLYIIAHPDKTTFHFPRVCQQKLLKAPFIYYYAGVKFSIGKANRITLLALIFCILSPDIHVLFYFTFCLLFLVFDIAF